MGAGLRVVRYHCITCSRRWRHGPGCLLHRRANCFPASYPDWRGIVKELLPRHLDAAVAFALVAEPVSLPPGSKLRLIVHDRLGEGYRQGVQVGLLGEGQLVP